VKLVETKPHLQGLIHRRTKKAPIRDTIPVPDGGFTIIRFRAENPGFWALETQSLLTAGLGMNLILQVCYAGN